MSVTSISSPSTTTVPNTGLSNASPLTISSLNAHILMLIERDELLRDLWVLGEVSNWKRAASGHIYFSLKDSGASISAVMWRNSATAHSWLPQEGDQVMAHGYVGVYAERGAYQLYVNQLRPAGRGQLYAQFEALKAKLATEGLLDAARKRAIPSNPRRIGIVTSADAAALRDMLRVLSARWPLVDVILFSTLVQGSDAPTQIEAAIQTANRYSQAVEKLDTLIVARGGGSIEDLWSFNDARVAYAIAASAIPVVSGVGHETDFTIADFVADLRAPTPSVAAASVVPDRTEILARLQETEQMLQEQAQQRIEEARDQLTHTQVRLARIHPQRQLDQHRQRLDDRLARLHRAFHHRYERMQLRLQANQQRLTALNPRNILSRGYSIVQTLAGTVVTDPSVVGMDEELRVISVGGEYRVKKT